MCEMEKPNIQGFYTSANVHDHQSTLAYFEELKSSEDGWRSCGDALARCLCSDEHAKFLCFQVLEHFVKTRYSSCDTSDQQVLRGLLLTWLHNQSQGAIKEKPFIRNKAAQVFTLVFVQDYPHKWPAFFTHLMQNLSLGQGAVDIYLRVLKSIHEEVVDKDIAHTPQENVRNTNIKDSMRVQCVAEMVDSWYQILESYETTDPELVCLCLDVIGAYVSWIDISLIANDRFISLFLHHLSVDVLRENACDCLHEIIIKGMEPSAKKELIESLIKVLENAGILPPPENEDSDFQAKLAKLLNGIGVQLITGWHKLMKREQMKSAADTLQSIEDKLHFVFRFLGNDDDDVSQTVTPYVHGYVGILKQIGSVTPRQRKTLETLLMIVIKKMKYDEEYDFAQEGEDEVMFLEYRKELKVLFDNIGQVDCQLVLVAAHNVINSHLSDWEKIPFMDVEVALKVLYMLGEAVTFQQLYCETSNFSALQEMINLLISSRVFYHEHPAIKQLFFETIVRYEKFFSAQTQHIPTVLAAFLDERGLRHANCTVRSRCAYLLSRFIKSHRSNMHNYTEDILKRIQGMLIVSTDNGYQPLITENDQMYLFEAAGVLIASSSAPSEKQLLYMKNLLSPVLVKFGTVFTKMSQVLDEETSLGYAQFLYHLMAVTSRASKAFSSHQSLKDSGCLTCFTEALQVFLQALDVPQKHRALIHSGVRQYLHRMIICLGEDLLPYIPIAVTYLLKDCQMKDIQEFIPLINQIITRFKHEIVPFLKEVFMPVVKMVFSLLGQPAHELDTQDKKEKETLRRSYFQFLNVIVSNNVLEAITSQDPQNVQQVLVTLIQGGVEFPDPAAQKLCFNTLRRLVEHLGGNGGVHGFTEFLYESIVPSCVLAPMKSDFDFNDAQTMLVLHEIACTQKVILQKQGSEYVHYMRLKYLPTLNLAPEIIEEYCQVVEQADAKILKNYLKVFFGRLRL